MDELEQLEKAPELPAVLCARGGFLKRRPGDTGTAGSTKWMQRPSRAQELP